MNLGLKVSGRTVGSLMFRLGYQLGVDNIYFLTASSYIQAPTLVLWASMVGHLATQSAVVWHDRGAWHVNHLGKGVAVYLESLEQSH